MDDAKYIYIVLSYNVTVAGKLIHWRARLKFWNRYKGDSYSHSSLSLNEELTRMMSFARKKLNNPFISGLIKEDIHKGVFARSKEKGKIAVAKIPVTKEQYQIIKQLLKEAWRERDSYKYDFKSLIRFLLIAKGVKTEKKYVCSHWISEILQKASVYDFKEKNVWDVRPFDFYDMFREHFVYIGATTAYDQYLLESRQNT